MKHTTLSVGIMNDLATSFATAELEYSSHATLMSSRKTIQSQLWGAKVGFLLPSSPECDNYQQNSWVWVTVYPGLYLRTSAGR